MDLKKISKYEDQIIDLVEHRDDMTTSDLQAIAGAIVRSIIRESEKENKGD